jgi:hypothetical protein
MEDRFGEAPKPAGGQLGSALFSLDVERFLFFFNVGGTSVSRPLLLYCGVLSSKILPSPK